MASDENVSKGVSAEPGVESSEESLEETWSEGLVGQALEIVESASPRQCVQAGPGTGKSYCMTRRLLRLIQQGKVKPAEVLAVTFTRTAANDLRKSLEGILGEKYRSFRASTLHSLCFNIVEGQSFLDIRSRHPRFLLAVTKSGCLNFEAAPMLTDLQLENKDYKGAREQTKRLKKFEAMWAERQSDPLGAPGSGVEAAYGTSVLNWLKFHQAMLVGELVKEAYEYMSAEPNTTWRGKFKAVLVDEYQDLNKLDQEVIDLLCEHEQTLCSIVGDLDQSIYSFRCAHPDGLTDYARRDGVQALSMEISRRCPTSHLAAAQDLIKQNTKKASLHPRALDDAKAGEISVRRWLDRGQEVEGVVKFVQYCIEKGVLAGETLVMVPSRLIGREIKTALRSQGIEAQSYFAEEQLEEEEAQKAFTLLTLLSNKADRVALRCWLGGWTDSQRAGSYKKLREHCEKESAEPWGVMEAVAAGELQVAGTSHLIEPFNYLRSRLSALEGKKGQDLLDSLFPVADEWAEDLRALAGGVIAEDITAKDLYELLVEGITQPTMPTEVSHVRVMSLHKAKGLTARASIIAGAVEGLIPRPYDKGKSFLTESEHQEEQRRLFYVAMTRSTEFLLICTPTYVDLPFAYGYQLKGVKMGSQFKTTVSQFISSLGNRLPKVQDTMLFP